MFNSIALLAVPSAIGLKLNDINQNVCKVKDL